MVEPSDSWYNIISTIHNSLNEMKKLPHNEVEITSHDNLKLKGIYYPNPKKSSVTVICLHGYASHPEKEMAFPGLFYLSQGYNVLITYQRAHGLSQGKFMSLGVLEQQDMIRWIDKVNEMNPSGNIIIHGLSMGGGIAFHLVDKNIKNVKCFIIDAPNHSLKNFFKEAAFEFYKKNQDKITFYTIQRFEKEFNTDINKSEIVDIASNSKYPILLTAGTESDFETKSVIPMDAMQRMYKALKAPKVRYRHKGSDHGMNLYAGDGYVTAWFLWHLQGNKTAAKAAALAAQLGCVADTVEQVAAKCDYIFLGVKPHMMEALLSPLSSVFAARTDSFVLVSMAAGLTIGDIQRMAGKAYPVIRIMPNTPVAVGSGVVMYDVTDNVTEEAKQLFCENLAAAGLLDPLPEKLMDAGSAVAGCGPAFAAMFLEALADGGVACGLPRDKAMRYAAATMAGAAQMYLQTHTHPGALKDAVCSPGGSTIQGVNALEQGAFRGTVMKAVLEAYEKTKALGNIK